MSEGSRHFERDSAVQQSLSKIARRLDDLGVPYALAGAMAMFYHGYRRFTEDVDILVTKEGLKTIHEQLEGRGYLPPFEESRHLRDSASGVRIEFLVAGQFPGDGKTKPVAFPNPAGVTIERDGIHLLNLQTLIELKLASGISSSDRLKDLTDVQELIKVLNLPESLAAQFNPYVQPKYRELWNNVHGRLTRYLLPWRGPTSVRAGQTLAELIATQPPDSELLKAMQADGVSLVTTRHSDGLHAYFVTRNPDIAGKYGMHDEAEFMDVLDDDA